LAKARVFRQVNARIGQEVYEQIDVASLPHFSHVADPGAHRSPIQTEMWLSNPSMFISSTKYSMEGNPAVTPGFCLAKKRMLIVPQVFPVESTNLVSIRR
jgi:hypothetical protein